MIYRKLIALSIVLFYINLSFSQQDKKIIVIPPEWSLQSNIYEVNLRQYSTSGTFKDFEKHLPRLKKMGVHILWFMPITPIGIEGRKMSIADLGSYYAVRNYKAVNEEFGTMSEWKKLVKNAQAMGFKVITDWVANHSAPDNPWIKNHPDFYAKDKEGKLVIPFDWTDTRKLNYDSKELRDSMIEAMKFWVKETGLDGFRCDVAEEVPLDFWKECISELKKIKNVFMLAEGEKAELHHAGFNATYAWSVMGAMSDLYTRKKNLWQFDSAVNRSTLPYPEKAMRMYFTTNHDENSWNGTEFEKYGEAAKAFAVFTQTFAKSIPLMYSGQEVPNKKRLKFFVKDPIEWKGFELAHFYTTLLHLRKSNLALSADADYKKLVTANDAAIFAYTREKNKQRVTVILNFSNHPQSFIINDPVMYGVATNVFSKKKETLSRKHVFIMEPWSYIVYDYNK